MKSVGEIIMAVGVVGAFIIPDFIAGVTKAQRMGKAAYPKEQKRKKWLWVCIFILIGCIGAGLFFLSPSEAEADEAVPEVPVFTWKGTDFAVVLFTSDRDCIREEFSGINLLEGRDYWLLRLQAVGDSAYSKPKEFPFMECVLVSSEGARIYPDNGSSTDEVPPHMVLLYSSRDIFERDELSLDMDGQVYPLKSVPDSDTYSSELFTPGPTATPEPTPTPDPEVVRLQTLLEEFCGREHSVLDEMPALNGKLYIVLFDSSNQPETSDEAAINGTDFHGVPAEFLASSYDEADTVLLIYEKYKQIGHYSTGGPAFRVFTDVAVICGDEEQLVCVAANDPPEKIQGTIGAGASGNYEPETALEMIVEKMNEP